jgi:hypothetical protein
MLLENSNNLQPTLEYFYTLKKNTGNSQPQKWNFHFLFFFIFFCFVFYFLFLFFFSLIDIENDHLIPLHFSEFSVVILWQLSKIPIFLNCQH